MNIYAINGSPRKKGNTAQLLQSALKGAESEGANTELIHLYDLNFKGCSSCFECRKKGGKSFGVCSRKDDLTAVLEKLDKSDAIIFGSPVYFAAISGEMSSFLERFLFPYLQYSKTVQVLFNRQIPTGFIYTLNSSKEALEHFPVASGIGRYEMYLQTLTSYVEPLFAYDTYQFNDYSKYVSDYFDEPKKARAKEEIFPQDLEKSFDMGARFARGEVEYSRDNFYTS